MFLFLFFPTYFLHDSPIQPHQPVSSCLLLLLPILVLNISRSNITYLDISIPLLPYLVTHSHTLKYIHPSIHPSSILTYLPTLLHPYCTGGYSHTDPSILHYCQPSSRLSSSSLALSFRALLTSTRSIGLPCSLV
ncbi:hypothetical protein M434DRAFT_320584 [Hypoxylon sp. CO27-5]|nr:hypothetical protein M434DRAFT_320584 [Hypoxylon sp. CO27-5]